MFKNTQVEMPICAKDKLLPHKPPLMSALLWFFPKLGVGERGLNFIFITNTRHSLAVTQLHFVFLFFNFFCSTDAIPISNKKRERKLLGYTRTSYIKSIYIYTWIFFFSPTPAPSMYIIVLPVDLHLDIKKQQKNLYKNK